MRKSAILLSALITLGSGGAALAMDPRLPLLEGEPSTSEKLAAFKKAYAQQPAVIAALAAAQGAAPRDRIHRALLALPRYAKAVADYAKGGDNVAAWKALAADAGDTYLKAYATYFLGRTLLNQDDLEGATEALEQVHGRLRVGTTWTDEAALYLGYAYARLPELKEGLDAASRARARRMLEAVAQRGDAPERVQEGATWLLRELRGEGMGPLLEIAKRMETIERMIRRTRTGEGTQARQKRVIGAIDKLIALMREKEKQGSGKGQGKGQGKGKGKKKPGNCKNGKKAGGQKNKTGAKESTLPGGELKIGKLNTPPRTATSEAWGKMKKKERDEAIIFLKKKFPARYRELIEKYYKSIAEKDAKK